MIPGKTVRGVIEGDSVSDAFIPRLVELYQAGKVPFDRLATFYDLDEISGDADDTEEGGTLKPVLRAT